MSAPRQHALHSPSSAHRYLRCPGSVAFCEGLPNHSNAAARQGTFAHECAADALRQGLDAWQLLDRTDGEFIIGAADLEPLQSYLDAVREPLTYPDGTKEPAAAAWIEERVSLAPLGIPEVWGTLDAGLWFRRARLLVVRDLKYGAGVFVDPKDNPQILAYAAGALSTFDELRAAGIERVIVDAVQPRHWLGQHNEPQELRPDDVRQWAHDVLRPGVDATLQPDAPLIAGEVQCQWCPGKTVCPAFRAFALGAATEVFAEPPMLPAVIGTAAALANDPPAPLPPLRANPPTVSELPVERLAEILDAAAALRKFVDRCEEEALSRAMRGIRVPGYKLVEKIGNRKWKEDDDTTATMLRVLGIDPFAEPKLISPAEADRRGGKSLRSSLAGLACKPRTGYDVVPESDTRPPAIPQVAADVFGAAPLPDDGDGVG